MCIHIQYRFVQYYAMHKYWGRPLSLVKISVFPEVSQMGHRYFRVVAMKMLHNLGKAKAEQD